MPVGHRSRAGTGRSPRRSGWTGWNGRSTSYAVQRAYDDPLVMADYRLTGEAFVGEVTLADPKRVDDTGKRPVLRPRIMLVTTDPVLVRPGTKLYSPTRPTQQARVVFVTPPAGVR